MPDFQPHPYQELMTAHQLGLRRSASWASMGLGKTIASLNAIDARLVTGEMSAPTLVVGPLRVVRTTWPEEARKWRHLRHIRVVPLTGTVAERERALKVDASVYAVNNENVPWLVERWGARWPYRCVYVDEATKLKSFRTRQGGRRAMALGSVAHKHVTELHELTGTPAPNGLVDLWGQAWFLDAGVRLGRTFSAFQERWFHQIPQPESDYRMLKPTSVAQEQIIGALGDLCLTIDARDWFALDDPIVRDIFVDLPPKVRALYRKMERELFIELDDASTAEAANAAARSSKCLQLANGAVYIDADADSDWHPKSKDWRALHEAKLDALDDIVTEAAGMPVLVAYAFRSDCARIRRAFPQARVLDAEPETQRAWNAGEIPLLLAYPGSCGHGINLQDGGNILVYFGHTWNLEHRLQILERIGPMRQLQSNHQRPVFVYRILGRDTVDEDCVERTDGKSTVQQALLDGMKRRGQTR